MLLVVYYGGAEMARITKTQRVIEHLLEKGSITSWDAIKLYGATRLSGIIFNLRHRGFAIDSVYQDGEDRFGNPSHYVNYILREQPNGFQAS